MDEVKFKEAEQRIAVLSKEELVKELLDAKRSAGDFDEMWTMDAYPYFYMTVSKTKNITGPKFQATISEGTADITLRLNAKGLREWSKYLRKKADAAWDMYIKNE